MANQIEIPKPLWSNILATQTPPKPSPPLAADLTGVLARNCATTSGIAVAIIDANAIIHGGERLSRCADRFVSVPEVMDEVRDPVSRHRLAVVPFTVQTIEPSSESLNKVIKFARSTGDLQTLSDVDLKLIALTYTLEAQIHGTDHLRDCPPLIQTVNVKRLPEKELPGWGSNVPNLEEWEALENEGEDVSNEASRILPLKDLNLNVVSETGSEHQDEEAGLDGPTRYAPKKKLVTVEGKKMAVDGVDASKGDFGGDEGEWMPAVSRSTHRRFLRRKARREYYDSLSEKDGVSEKNNEVENAEGDRVDEVSKELDSLEILSEINDSVDDTLNEEDDEDDDISEQSLNIRSLSESSVACITSDFAMQNVILQMGLRLVAPGGMQIRQLQRWVLRCHACYTVTPEVGKIFCPKCGNGGTLRKVAVTVAENGITLAARRPRVTLRGTKFSLPLPQGGRDAMTKNLILREDQLPQKYLHPKTKKKVVNKDEDDDFFVRQADSIFSQHHNDKRSFQPPVRKALAVFSGKRNPNDNHYSRSMHNK